MIDTLELSRRIASKAHAGQARRGGAPAINHASAVAGRVRGDDEAEAVAWLHDVLEDTEWSRDDLWAEDIPEKIINAVQILTHPKHEPYIDYINRVKTNALARKVKLADIQSNLEDSPSERQKEKYTKALKILKGT